MMYSMMRPRTDLHGRGTSMRFAALLLGLLFVLPPALSAREASPPPASPPLAVPGLLEAHLAPAHWSAERAEPDRVILSPEQIAAQNARMRAEGRSIIDIEGLPAELDGARVRGWIEDLSQLPGRPLFDEHGAPVGRDAL